ncbi:protein kinase, ATP binding site-containing protein [Tanacetum coccineum]
MWISSLETMTEAMEEGQQTSIYDANVFNKTWIGKGGFGDVYKGKSSKSWQYCTSAIKRLNRKGAQGKEEFCIELDLIFKFHHQNNINFLGYCDVDNEMIIVNEYDANGSMDGYLEDINKRSNLTWVHQLKIWHQLNKYFRSQELYEDSYRVIVSFLEVIPKRIIFYRHGVTDDKFYNVLFFELLAIYEIVNVDEMTQDYEKNKSSSGSDGERELNAGEKYDALLRKFGALQPAVTPNHNDEH